jgi:N-acetylglutamate synthase
MSRTIDLDEVRRLEERAFAGWPALESRDVAGWRLRFSGGYTKRANSINALGRDARTDRDTVDALEGAYRERGQPPIWRLSPLAPPAMADHLRGPAYRTIERSLVQMAPLPGGFTVDPDVHIHPEPTVDWLNAFATYSPVQPRHRGIMQRMLMAIAAPKGFALVQHDGEPMAMAIGAVQGDHMGLFDVLVMPHARRRGLARRVTESLYGWAFGQGARVAYLQVVATNQAAMPLYAAQGFRTVYAYEYRVPSSP